MKKNQFTSEIALFGNVKVLAVSGLLTALSVVLAALAKVIFGSGPLRLTFENLPIFIGGFSFGPVIAALIALCADLLSCLINGMAPIPLISVGAVLTGAVGGIIYRYVLKKSGMKMRVIISVAAAHIVGSITVKTAVLLQWYGKIVYFRIPIYAGIIIIESVLIIFMLGNKEFARQIEKIKNGS